MRFWFLGFFRHFILIFKFFSQDQMYCWDFLSLLCVPRLAIRNFVCISMHAQLDFIELSLMMIFFYFFWLLLLISHLFDVCQHELLLLGLLSLFQHNYLSSFLVLCLLDYCQILGECVQSIPDLIFYMNFVLYWFGCYCSSWVPLLLCWTIFHWVLQVFGSLQYQETIVLKGGK